MEISGEELYSLIEKNMSDIICLHDLEGYTLYISQSVKAILGYHPEELIGQYAYDYIYPNDRERMRIESHNKALEGLTTPTRIDIRVRQKDGYYIWLETQLTPIFDSSGNVSLILAISRNINDRKRMEEMLVESERKLKEFARSIPDISCILDEDGRYLEVFGLSDMYPKDREKLRGLTLNQVKCQEEADFLMDILRMAITHGKPQRFFRQFRFGGEMHWLEGTMMPMGYLANGKKTVAVVSVDVTERKNAERMLQSAHEVRRRSEFINDVINGTITLNEKSLGIGNMLGIDFSVPLFCCLLKVERNNPEGEKSKPDNAVFKNKLIDYLNADLQYIVCNYREYIGILCPAGKSDSQEECFLREISRIGEHITQYNPGLSVAIGVSDIHVGADIIRIGLLQAWNAIVVARCDEKQRKVRFFRDLGIYQLLASLGGKEQAVAYVQNKIGKLIEYDRQKGADFLVTLEEILQNSSLIQAADKMFLHHKTMAFRKRRIENLLGVSLDNFEERIALAAALKLNKLTEVIVE